MLHCASPVFARAEKALWATDGHRCTLIILLFIGVHLCASVANSFFFGVSLGRQCLLYGADNYSIMTAPLAGAVRLSMTMSGIRQRKITARIQNVSAAASIAALRCTMP